MSRMIPTSAAGSRCTLTALAGGDTAGVRRETLQGRDYLVVPVVAIIGDSVVWPSTATGPEFVPADVISYLPESWNGRVVVIDHPSVESNGANNPTYIDSAAFGSIYNARYEDGALQLDAWLDIARAAELGDGPQSVIDRAESGDLIEVSIGVWYWSDDTPGIAANGQRYTHSWIFIVPDHLAMFDEDGVGACNNEMGCGAPRTAAAQAAAATGGLAMAGTRQLGMLALNAARKPVFSGTEDIAWSAPSWSDWVKGLYTGDSPPDSISSADDDLKKDIAAHTLLGDPAATNLRDLAMFPVVDPRNGKLNKRALQAVTGSRGSQANILKAARDSAQAMARKLLKSEFGIDSVKAAAVGTGAAVNQAATYDDGMSDSDTRNLLRDALTIVEPDWYYLWIDRYYDSAVIYCVGGYLIDDYHMYRRTYTMADDGTVTINADRIEVEMEITVSFEPVAGEPALSVTVPGDGAAPATVSASAGAATTKPPKRQSMLQRLLGRMIETENTDMSHNCSCQSGKDQTMNRNDAITALLKAQGTPFDEADRAMLAGLSDEKFAKLAAKVGAGIEGTPAPAQVAAASSGTCPVAPVAPQQAAATPATGGGTPAMLSIPAEQYATLMRVAQAAAVHEANQRAVLVADLSGRQKEYTADQLAAMPFEDLHKLGKLLGSSTGSGSSDGAPYDYSGRGIPIAPASPQNDEPLVKPWTNALAKRNGNAATVTGTGTATN